MRTAHFSVPSCGWLIHNRKDNPHKKGNAQIQDYTYQSDVVVMQGKQSVFQSGGQWSTYRMIADNQLVSQ
uniref:Lipoprotein n=1 Tax=Heterorhabditis bacteriophora TaxID=37862 RepID=A0A1I7XFV1_HETBA